MNEPQVWTLIGVFAAGLFATITLMSTMFVRILRSELGGLRAELRGELDVIRSEIRAVNHRLDRLDADLNALMRHAFDIDRG